LQNPNEQSLIPLSAEAFIAALKGKTVIDENGVERCFLENVGGRRRVKIDNVIVFENITLKNSFNHSIEILNVLFKRNFTINNCEFRKSFAIKGGVFNRSFCIANSSFKGFFNILGGIFKGVFAIYSGQFQDSFYVDGGEFKDAFFIHSGEFRAMFHIKKGVFRKNFIVFGGKFFYEFCLYGGEFCRIFSIKGGDFYKIEINNGTLSPSKGFINLFHIIDELNNFIEIVSMSNINYLFLGGKLNKTNSVKINNISLNSLVIQNFENAGQLSFTDLSFKNEIITSLKKDLENNTIFETRLNPSWIKINNSKLGQTEFQSVHFAQAQQIAIDNSDLNKSSMRVEYFPDKLKNKVYSDFEIDIETMTVVDGTQKLIPHRIADFYNDLANIMKRQGNKRMELNYIATQQSLLKQSLNWHTDFGDWFPLFLSKWSNKYGTSWWRALIFILSFSIIAFAFYGWAHPNIEYCFFNCNLDGIVKMIGYYFEFLLPTHRFNFVEGAGGLAKAVDFFARIGIGYGIYQFVQAFRRLGRR